MPTRRTSRRSSRHLRRNARPIRVDQAVVDRLMQLIANALSKFKQYAQSREWSRSDRLFDRGGIGLFPATINNLAGLRKKILVSILLTYAPPRERGGFIDLRKETDVPPYAQEYDGLIEIYIWPLLNWGGKSINWSRLDHADSLDGIRKTLVHELVHAQDYLGSEKVRSSLAPGSRSSDPQYSQYLRQKNELRAFMRMITDEVVGFARNINDLNEKRQWQAYVDSGCLYLPCADFELTPPPQLSSEDIVDLIKLSPTWNEIKLSLSMDGAKLIMKGVVTALEDEGIIRIE